MSAVLSLYDHIKAVVTSVDGVRHFDWYKSDMSNTMASGAYLPAVYLEFREEWQESSKEEIELGGDFLPSQKGTIYFSLHIFGNMNVVGSIDSGERAQFLIAHEIYKKLHFSSALDGSGNNITRGSIQRTGGYGDLNYSNIKDLVQEYRADIFETGISGIDQGVISVLEGVSFDSTIDANPPPHF